MLLPYAGPRGEKVLKNLRKRMPVKLRPKIVYNGTKISLYFPVKDKIDIMHCSDVVYHYESNAENIKDDYVRETKCRFGKRIKEHQGRDQESAIVKNFKEKY